MKRLLLCLLLCGMAVLLPLSVSAGSEPPTLVFDEADLLSEAEEAALQERLYEITKAQSCSVAVVTVSSVGARTPAAYAASYYRAHSIGYGKEDSGVMLLIVLSTRDYEIYTCGEGYDRLDDGDLDDIEEAILPHLKNNDFSGAFAAFADACEEGLDERFDLLGNLLVAVAIGAIVSVAVMQGMKGQLKSVRPRREAAEYVREGSFVLHRSHDRFLYRNVVRTRRASSSSSSGGRSSGRSGSRGGKF